MKKVSTVAANESRNVFQPKLTIGLLGMKERSRLTGGSTGCNENAQLAPSEKDRSPRVRMEGWRQWRLGRGKNLV